MASAERKQDRCEGGMQELFIGYMNPVIRSLPDGRMDASPFFRRTPHVQGTLPRLRQGGVTVTTLSFGLNAPELFPGRQGTTPGRRRNRRAPSLSRKLRHAGGRRDRHGELRAARKAGKLAFALHLVDHIAYMVNLAGINHVGLGTDYDLGTIPREVDRADKLPALVQALQCRGYSGAQVAKQCFRYFLRVYRTVLRD